MAADPNDRKLSQMTDILVQEGLLLLNLPDSERAVWRTYLHARKKYVENCMSQSAAKRINHYGMHFEAQFFMHWYENNPPPNLAEAEAMEEFEEQQEDPEELFYQATGQYPMGAVDRAMKLVNGSKTIRIARSKAEIQLNIARAAQSADPNPADLALKKQVVEILSRF